MRQLDFKSEYAEFTGKLILATGFKDGDKRCRECGAMLRYYDIEGGRFLGCGANQQHLGGMEGLEIKDNSWGTDLLNACLREMAKKKQLIPQGILEKLLKIFLRN